jgi:hypothetical protein
LHIECKTQRALHPRHECRGFPRGVGNDAEISAFQAAIQSDLPLQAIDPKGRYHTLRLGEKAATYRGHIQLPGHTRPLRHLLAFSRRILQNGTEGSVYLLDRDPGLVWATVVSFLGLPATPEWAQAGVKWLSDSGKLIEMEGYGCEPIVVKTTREEMLTCIGEGVRNKALPFPEYDGPIFWPQYGLKDIVSPAVFDDNEEDDETGGELKAAA